MTISEVSRKAFCNFCNAWDWVGLVQHLGRAHYACGCCQFSLRKLMRTGE